MEFITDTDTDIVLLQETWLKKLDTAIIFNIREYNYEISQTRKPRAFNTGGGVAILFKEKYNIKTVMVQTFPSFENTTCSFLTNIGIVNLTTIYYPGCSPKHTYTQVQFLLNFKDFLNSCSEGIYLVTGNFNIHYENSDKHKTKLLKNILDQNNFTQLITFPTHKAKGTIDLCIINNSASKYISDLNRNNHFLNNLSDHYPICFKLNAHNKTKPSKITIKSRNLEVFDIEQYKQQIKKYLRHDELKILLVSFCIDIYNTTMQNSLDIIAPVVEKTVQHRPFQSWFNLKLKNLKKKKCQAERKYKKFSNRYDLQEYKKQQMTYYSNIRQVRVDYYSRILQNSKKKYKIAGYHNSKIVWRGHTKSIAIWICY